jgi:UDP-N-acetyl-D-mannosaminuronate dehydrogenase
MPLHTVGIVFRCLNAQNKSISKSTISLLGLSFRADVKETRFAASLKILKHLQRYNPKNILAHDPYFSEQEISAMGFTPASFEDALQADCIVLVASHQEFRHKENKLQAKKDQLVDTTNLIPDARWKVGRIPTE